MNKTMRWRRQIVCGCLLVGTTLFCSSQSQAQFNRLSFTLSGGAGYVSLDDWGDSFSKVSLSHYEKDKFGQFLESRIAYHLTDKYAVAFSLEKINTCASLFLTDVFTSEFGDTVGVASHVIEWDFLAVPVGLSFEFYPKSSEDRVAPFLGAGLSYLLSDVEAEYRYVYSERFSSVGGRGSRDGVGYGIHLYVGVQSKLTDHFLIFSRLRGRYADGMAFSEEEGDVKVEFTGFDFTMGWGWRF